MGRGAPTLGWQAACRLGYGALAHAGNACLCSPFMETKQTVAIPHSEKGLQGNNDPCALIWAGGRLLGGDGGGGCVGHARAVPAGRGGRHRV